MIAFQLLCLALAVVAVYSAWADIQEFRGKPPRPRKKKVSK